MKAKLIKKGDVYFLDELKIDGYFTIANSLAKPNGLMYNLSLKNCQAIERGYDLDELFESVPHSVQDKKDYWKIRAGFMVGFQKALELIGDKKYSEEDVRKAMDLNRKSLWTQDESIQSLQQTEFDVEIIEECLDKDCDGVDRKGDCITTGKPKLDAEGCLILKRI